MKRRRSSFPLALDPPLARAVARRAKTQLRRLATTTSLADGSVVPRPCGLKTSSTYEVTAGQTGSVVARVVVTGVHLEQLGAVDQAAAAAEGHQSVALFMDWWLRRHDRGWPPQEEKLCSVCGGHTTYADHDGELVDCDRCDEVGVVMGDAPTTDTEVADRFASHAGRLVWVVTFMLDDRVFLHKQSQRGYTSNPAEAMVGEPEVIGAPDQRWVARAERRRRDDRADVDATRLSLSLSYEDELAVLQRLAAERGVDLTRERHVIEQRRAAIERKVRRAA